MLNVRKGTMDLLEGLDRMYTECKKALLQNQIYQWDDSYPAREHISYHLEQDELYCLFEDDSLVGAVVLNEWQSPEYKRIDWSETDGRFLIVHSFVIHPLSQGKGYSKVLLSFWESEARRKGYNSIRLDCFTRNPVSLSLYEKTIIFAEVLFILKVNSLLTTGIIAMKNPLTIVRGFFYFFTFRNTKCAQPKLQYSYKYSDKVLIFVSYVARWLLSSKNPRNLSCSYPQSPTI